MRGLRRRKAVLGLDIGAGAVKLVELSGGVMRSCGLALRERATPRAQSSSVGAIEEALRQAAPRARRAVLGLNGADTVLHRFALPKDLPAAEREEQARLLAGKAASFPLEEAAFDYAPEEETTGSSQRYRMAIARSARVESLCDAARQAGLQVAAVDVTSFAICGALTCAAAQDETLAVLDGGHGRSSLSVHCNGQALFQHSQPFGCSELALRLSRAYGLPGADANRALAEGDLPGGAPARIARPFLRDLARHAARAIQLYLTSRSGSAAPQRMLLWGGAALLPDACEALQDELDLPVEVLRPPAASTGGGEVPEIVGALFGAYALACNDHV